jgi:hypothetical protein
MQCLNCGGAFEWAGNGTYARCTRCLSLFGNQNGQLTPIKVEAPGGGNNPEFNAIYAQNLGFGPPPPGTGQQPQHNLAAGTFDMGGGQQLRLKVDGKSPENFLKDKASSMIWGWIIGAVVVLFLVIGAIVLAGYIFFAAKSGPGGVASGSAVAAKWDGKSTLECGGNDHIDLTGTTATVSGTAIHATGNCVIEMTGVNITAGTGIDASANAKVSMTGGSIKATTNSVVASANAHVDCFGTTVTGKSKSSGAAKITGAN